MYKIKENIFKCIPFFFLLEIICQILAQRDIDFCLYVHCRTIKN